MVHDKCTEMGITNTNTTINIHIAYILGDHDHDNHHITHSHHRQTLIKKIENMATVNRIRKERQEKRPGTGTGRKEARTQKQRRRKDTVKQVTSIK